MHKLNWLCWIKENHRAQSWLRCKNLHTHINSISVTTIFSGESSEGRRVDDLSSMNWLENFMPILGSIEILYLSLTKRAHREHQWQTYPSKLHKMLESTYSFKLHNCDYKFFQGNLAGGDESMIFHQWIDTRISCQFWGCDLSSWQWCCQSNHTNL